MKIGIIDADLIGRKQHRFPNLCCMKVSGYYKAYGNNVTLLTNYDGLDAYDKVYVAKVFTDTSIPDNGLLGNPLDAPNVIKGGTGFYYDNAPPLPPQIEHAMPDYHLYDGVCDFKYYTDYSIGYLTRGCFRHCPFCVNRRSNKVVAHSPLKEFLDPTRKKICLLDDNFFGFDGWKDLLLELRATGKPFQFKQGLDFRLLDEEKAALLFTSKYDGDFIFAFDDPDDKPLIEEKMRRLTPKIRQRIKFYVLCGFDRRGKYDDEFWARDLQSVLDRAEFLKLFNCKAYVMRHKNYLNAPNPKAYTKIAAWANQPQFFFKKTLSEYIAREKEYREYERTRRRRRGIQ